MACSRTISEKEDPKDQAKLVRSKNINLEAPLEKKSTRPDILAKLIQLEQEIMAKAKACGLI